MFRAKAPLTFQKRPVGYTRRGKPTPYVRVCREDHTPNNPQVITAQDEGVRVGALQGVHGTIHVGDRRQPSPIERSDVPEAVIPKARGAECGARTGQSWFTSRCLLLKRLLNCPPMYRVPSGPVQAVCTRDGDGRQLRLGVGASGVPGPLR